MSNTDATNAKVYEIHQKWDIFRAGAEVRKNKGVQQLRNIQNIYFNMKNRDDKGF
jgi:hypothetical protein